ncbi:MAG: pentapeptide repeat-containing protein, partial [Myxococcota bacterium]|nr:pentapeptide repeat-containing protein [Myxococcota bacterium]
GLEALELDEVDLDRVIGLDGEEAPPPPPPPVHGVTSFTREQRTAAESMFGGAPTGNEPPPFRPQDSAGSLVFRALKDLTPPLWALDVPGLRLPTPSRLTSGSSLESQLRDVVKARLDGRPATTDPATEGKAHQALRMGAKDAALAALYLKEIGVDPHFRFSAAKALRAELRRELEVDDPTGQVDPRTAGALLTLSLTHEAPEFLGEVRRRLAAAQLFQALLEAGFTPENNWEEAVDASEAAIELTATAGLEREALGEAFGDFTNLPDEVRFRRLAYLGEAAISLEQLARLPEGTEPAWLTGPEYRECHDREMEFVQALTAEQIPQKVPELAETELSVPKGTIPEDSDSDLFLHFRCSVCGKEKLLVQSPE